MNKLKSVKYKIRQKPGKNPSLSAIIQTFVIQAL